MRVVTAVFLVLGCGVLPCCGTSPARRVEVNPGPPGHREIDAAVTELALNGSFEAEARLTAAGPAAEAGMRGLLLSADPDVRRRATLVLLSGGHDLSLSYEEQVDLVLFEFMRTDGQPWSRLSALLRLDGLGEHAGPGLRSAALGGGERAAVAQRLLSQQAEAK